MKVSSPVAACSYGLLPMEAKVAGVTKLFAMEGWNAFHTALAHLSTVPMF